MKELKIKIQASTLRKKSRKELLKMRKQMEYHLLETYMPKNKDEKGFNVNEEKRNIARINTILKTKEE